MKELNRFTMPVKQYPERIIQFGEGNFLRAFVDWIICKMNENTDFKSSVVVVQPIEQGMVELLNHQQGLYHLILKGLKDGNKIYETQLIDSISRGVNPYKDFEGYLKLAKHPDIRFIISNTTEAGIAFNDEDSLTDRPPKSFPGKLTQFLYYRFKAFNGAIDKGVIILPCELIFTNGTILKQCIEKYIEYWKLEEEFTIWFHKYCKIYNTLVDRIVPGYPKETAEEIKKQLKYNDQLLVEGEIFHLWVIEAPQETANEFPANKAGLNVVFVPDEEPYHTRKVTLLNGPHTVLSPVGYLAGLNTVKECMDNPTINNFIRQVIFEELIPGLNLPEEELIRFANDILERFSNPYIKHQLTSIMLNSFSKYKTRDLPGLKKFLQIKGTIPNGLVLGLAAIIYYYRGGKRGKDFIIIQDDEKIINLLQEAWQSNTMHAVAVKVLEADFIWGEDLNLLPGLTQKLVIYLESIQKKGMIQTVKELVNE